MNVVNFSQKKPGQRISATDSLNVWSSFDFWTINLFFANMPFKVKYLRFIISEINFARCYINENLLNVKLCNGFANENRLFYPGNIFDLLINDGRNKNDLYLD